MPSQVIKPPTSLATVADFSRSVFLAGSIDLGVAADWQQQVTDQLGPEDLLILNPRREAWDDTWVQSIHNSDFRGQVEWELDAQDSAAMIAMYFAPGTKAPITLLELGLFATSKKVVVCCPDGFWRRGNVEVVCHRYDIPLFSQLDELVAAVRTRFAR